MSIFNGYDDRSKSPMVVAGIAFQFAIKAIKEPNCTVENAVDYYADCLAQDRMSQECEIVSLAITERWPGRAGYIKMRAWREIM